MNDLEVAARRWLALNWPPTDGLAVGIITALGLVPVAIYLALDGAGAGAAASTMAMAACVPCGLLAMRVSASWRRSRRMRSYWDVL